MSPISGHDRRGAAVQISPLLLQRQPAPAPARHVAIQKLYVLVATRIEKRFRKHRPRSVLASHHHLGILLLRERRHAKEYLPGRGVDRAGDVAGPEFYAA